MPIRVKICCVQSLEEARLAVEHGAAALGLVSRMPSGPGVIDEDQIAEIAAAVPPPVSTFLLTSETDPLEIIQQQRRCRCSTLQLCELLPTEPRQKIRSALPGIGIVQVVHVTGPEAIVAARKAAEGSDALLLDTGSLDGPTRELGGTGRTHDWAVSRTLREESPVPVFLAGGLRADNVGEGIRTVEPFAVDVCSGVRTDGQLDEKKLAAFVAAVRAAEAS